MERTKGLEPSTLTLGRLHSTTELRPLKYCSIITHYSFYCKHIIIFNFNTLLQNNELDYYNNLLNYNINAAELERVIGAPIKESDIDL